MTADLLSNFIGMTLQATGNNNNAWGTILNGSALVPLERAIAGNISHAVSGGTLDLSTNPPPAAVSQVLDMLQVFTGTLTANQIVILPNLSRLWTFSNQTSGAFQLLLQTPGGALVNIPQGTNKLVVCDGQTSVVRLDRDTVGHFEYSAVVDPGFLQCSGQSLLKTDFPDLYAKIGTIFGSADSLHFTLPLLTDTGRFLRSSTSSLTVGTYQANLNASHTHTLSGAPSAGTLGTDTQGAHVHGVSDPGHTHVLTQALNGSNGSSAGASAGSNTLVAQGGMTGINIASAVTGVSIQSAGAHTHNITGAPGIGTLAAQTSGGAEARPEALAVVISIRY